MELTNYNKAKQDIIAAIAAQAKRNLDTPGDRIDIKSKWEKSGDDWQPISSSKSTKRRKISNTGNLSSSITYSVIDNILRIETASYGKTIDLGRKPGEYVPPNDLESWARQKGLKKESVFLANRKIKFFGMPATYFLTTPFEDSLETAGQILIEAYMKDIGEYIKTQK